MYTNQTCDEHIRLTNAERYASQRMTVEEAETFEDHFVTCAECQAEVRFVSAVAGSFGGAAEPAPALSRTRRRGLVGGVALALAAGLVALMISRSLLARFSPMPTQLNGRTMVYGSLYCSNAPFAKYSDASFWKPYVEIGGGEVSWAPSGVGKTVADS